MNQLRSKLLIVFLSLILYSEICSKIISNIEWVRAEGKSTGNMVLKCTSKEVVPSGTSCYILRTKIPPPRKVRWSTNISVAGWTVKAELLQKSLENSWGPPHPSMTIITPLVITFLWKSFCTVGMEDHSNVRSIKEAILIRVNDPSLNRNIGKYPMPHIWYEVLVRSPELKLK